MNTEATITKSYPSHTFGANKICDIPVNLGVRHYSGRNYYMWDAAENLWSGHEWDSAAPWQPTENGKADYRGPRSADDDRWYHEGNGPFEASFNPLFKQLPNANEIGWYVKMGDAHWDDTPWEVFGKIYTGGIWLKKLSVIAKEKGKELADLKMADPNGTNLLTSSNTYSISPKSGKPADSEISKYFFLPALGYYDGGQLNILGSSGYYWSSSAKPSGSSHAYYLSLDSDNVGLHNYYRYSGNVAQPFE